MNFSVSADPNSGPVGIAGQTNAISWSLANTECIGNYDLYSSYAERDALASVSVEDLSSPTGRSWKPCNPYQVTITQPQSENIK